MKLIKVCTVSAAGLLMIAATKGAEVSAAQIAQFRVGVATVTDVENKLGMPQKSGLAPGGGTAIDYLLLDESPNATSAVPFAREVAGAMNLHETRVEFQFDVQGHLATVQTSQRDIVCPHHACGPAQMSQPWIPSPTQGD
ncbi:MAG TPA: hypothetical protein VJP88_05485 [Caulobacteraceae bacterium]|nr:hypothetical protein [Caulobacteraceae bacterium]